MPYAKLKVLAPLSLSLAMLGAACGGGKVGTGSAGNAGSAGDTGSAGSAGSGGAGAGGMAGTAPPTPITITVTVAPASADLAVGGTAKFSATLTGATIDGVTWTASGGAITADGAYTAPALGGSYIVTARSVEDPRAFGTAKANVTGSTLSQPDAINDHTVSPAIYLRQPMQGMEFLAPATVTMIADTWDSMAPTKVDFMDGTAVVDTVNTAGMGTGSAAGYFLRGFARNLAAGTHELWVRETSVGGATHDSEHLTVTVVAPPTYGQTITLTSDMNVTGDLSWVGTAAAPILVQGNGFAIRSADTWTGKVTMKYVHFRDIGADPSGLPTFTAVGMRLATTGDIDIENCLFEHAGQVILFANGTAGVTFRGNTFNENTAVAVDNNSYWDGTNGYSIVTFTGTSTAAKVFAGNRVAMGWARFEAAYNWTIGGDKDADSNILMGPRGGLLVNGNQKGMTNTVLKGNFSKTHCPNRWSQCTNALFQSNGTGIVLEHNVMVGGWVVRPFGGEARYNVFVAGGEAFLQNWSANAKMHHNIVLNLGLRAPGFNNNVFDLYTSTATGVQIYNNTFDGGGTNLQLYGPAVRIRGGAVLKSLRSNAFVHFPYYLAPVVTGDRDVETKTPGGATIADYIDYNAFFNPEKKPAASLSYYGKVTSGAAAGSDGFGAHDVGGINKDVDPKFAGQADATSPESKGQFPFSNGDIWARKVSVSSMLQRFANDYRPDTGSPLIDAGDPADGAGNDIGAVDTGQLSPMFTAFDAWGR